MNRAKKTQGFWSQKEPTVESMFLKEIGADLDLEERREILQEIPNLTGRTVLELGAGIGRYTNHFAWVASQVTAVDFAPQFVEKNRARHASFPNVNCLCADAMDLEFPDESFDCIFMNALMMYLDHAEVEQLQERLARWLKKGGTLFFRENCTPTGEHRDDGYYVHYRTLHFYTELFDRQLQFIKQDNLKMFVHRYSNPFQCYWVYNKA